jgi:hypothetical protein
MMPANKIRRVLTSNIGQLDSLFEKKNPHAVKCHRNFFSENLEEKHSMSSVQNIKQVRKLFFYFFPLKSGGNKILKKFYFGLCFATR